MFEELLAGPTPDYIGYGYAVLLVLGGLVGAIKRGSKMSFIAGGLGAALQVYGSQRVTVDRTDVLPALYTNVALCVLMTWRFVMTEKFMPPGLISMLSLMMISRYAIIRL